MNLLLLKKAKDLIFPNVCVNCERIIDKSYDLCSECNKKINFLTKHYCNVCGVVIPDNIDTCGRCISNPLPFKTQLDNAIFGLDAEQKITHGARLKNLQIQTSAYGKAIPIIYGTSL